MPDGRIARRFAACDADGRAALVGYLTAGDPNLERSREAIFAACESGLDVLELGVPFSDPCADGSTIQAAMVRALQTGMTLDRTLGLAAQVRARFSELPIVLFSYANPLLREGPASLVQRAVAAGIDGLLVVDLPPEHAGPLREHADPAGLQWVGLCAPTTTAARRARVAAASNGFVYAVSLTGVTGAELVVDEPLREYLASIRSVATAPVAVGFGVSSPVQVAALSPLVDGVVVGSALVRAAMEGDAALRATVRSLADATRRRA